MGKNKLLKIAVVAIAMVLLGAGALFAAEVDITYEVKYLLDSQKVLDSNNVLNKDLQDLFAVEKTNQRVVLYVDNAERTFDKGGWINRVREKDGKKNIELAYKRRYAVQGTDIDAAIERAKKDNPTITDGRFEAEVDWSYDKMTLSFTYEVKIDKPKGGIKGMSEDAILSAVLDNMPQDEAGWKFARLKTSKVANPRFAGPVDYIRYTGSYKGVEIDIEVWDVKGTIVTELSFEDEDFKSASELRNEIMGILEGKGILQKKASLKTQMILDAYI